jgi:hypothetical protein
VQFLVRGDDNFAFIASCWRFATRGDSVIADDKDAHAGLLFTAAVSPLVTPLTLCQATKATLFWIMLLRCSANFE